MMLLYRQALTEPRVIFLNGTPKGEIHTTTVYNVHGSKVKQWTKNMVVIIQVIPPLHYFAKPYILL